MLTLQSDDASVVLAPEQGGAILGWTHGRVALLRHAASSAVVPGDTREMGAFPLVPYSNRIARGAFNFGGRHYQLALNFGDHPNSIHGVGWQRAWRTASIARDAATVTLDHAPDVNWPFAFTAAQTYHLMPNALRVTLSLTNRHTAPAPAGLGLHPYFPRGDATLRFHADAVWRNGPTQLPSERTMVPQDWDHTEGRRVGIPPLDNCFEGWDGRATLSWANRQITLEASDIFRHVIVYTPPSAPFFCVEPVSHMNDAINHGGMQVLEPGETLQGQISFRLT
jgi:aldose 1-epimerase